MAVIFSLSGMCMVGHHTHNLDQASNRWFDLVLVLQTDNTVLYERLEKRYENTACNVVLHTPTPPTHRGYSQKKISENIECEIMQVIVEEARDSYKCETDPVHTQRTVH